MKINEQQVGPDGKPVDDARVTRAEALLASFEARRSRLQAQVDRYAFRWRWALLSSIPGFVLLAMILSEDQEGISDPVNWLIVIIGGLIVGPSIYMVTIMYIQLILRATLRQLDRQLATAGAERLQEKLEEDFFTRLVQINFKYIDQYYLQTQAQADKSFLLSLIVSVIGLLIVIAGIVLMYLKEVNSAYVATASGILSEFIAAVFFFLYNRTISKMGQYHQKLVLTQNISLALKIAESLPEKEKARSQAMLIDRLTDGVNRLLISSEVAPNRRERPGQRGTRSPETTDAAKDNA